ncbi:TPA: hypothetical protein CPT81_05785 [Candidatus Gastranaerophilales bacterium HUM_20]|jgi:hypothetical protein|nr:MAG: hypothetical protein BHW55_10045 [Candidatus Melainabacteria bacterium 35_41]CDE89832.1 unknown [Clostridium sp. CAG:729]DAB20914.1 MAG TPA: hypothetical protein CPT81_05785 [Candidatus Gastranaerophilales bacterium HUM_20]
MKTEKEIAEEMAQVVEQMRLDDIEDNPDIVDEFFDCDCCGENKCLAGSIEYEGYRLCNDCVLLAETGFALKKIKNVTDLISAIEDKHLEGLVQFVREEEARKNN